MSSLITVIPAKTCSNCIHFSYKSDRYGECLSPKNDVKAGPLAMIRYYVKDKQAQEELVREIERGTRYPENFGCIFFEPSIKPTEPDR